jgi:hypothetical protein
MGPHESRQRTWTRHDRDPRSRSRYQPGDTYVVLPGQKRRSTSRIKVVLMALFGSILFTAVCSHVLGLSWGAWNKIIDRYGPTRSSVAEPTEATDSALIVLAIIFLLTTVILAACLHANVHRSERTRQSRSRNRPEEGYEFDREFGA